MPLDVFCRHYKESKICWSYKANFSKNIPYLAFCTTLRKHFQFYLGTHLLVLEIPQEILKNRLVIMWTLPD
jgi:hypothetical protein